MGKKIDKRLGHEIQRKYKEKTILVTLVFVVLASIALILFLNTNSAPSEVPNDCVESNDWPECAYEFAINEQDIRICEHTGIMWYKCVEQIAGTNLDSCYLLTGEMKDRCISNVAYEREDISLCEKAGSDERVCYDNFGYDNLDVCLGLYHIGARDSCLWSHGMRRENVSLCELIQEDPLLKYRCFEDNGIIKPELCEEISNEDHKEDCFESAGGKLNDSFICEKIENHFSRDTCLRKVAISLRDVSICEKITKDYAKKNCIKKVEEAKR